MLSFFMRNRDRAILVNVQSAAASPLSVGHRLKQNLQVSAEVTVPGDTDTVSESVLLEYLSGSLLTDHLEASELYDEIRSAGTVLRDSDTTIVSAKERNDERVPEFLQEVETCEALKQDYQGLKNELALSKLSHAQAAEELELYAEKYKVLKSKSDSLADYLRFDPLLRISHRLRELQ
jgi:hypothetical protein